ncbi:type I-B CRISPR-associated endonuclease Cas1b [Syntrophomonas wolfei]|uniref:CRISPR-associated endonuclease Cas1 n=1 Tax=Syntrophomonas wolfei subsp. wolfei (strain DSM 2245B / Goettingen) TaxID=335541 RepID=Q0AW03_SYNWW|nr:type I-B CRISPR-associated endonuclease Cas1b [Syntrophomonas wolfei]ABI69101.1 CRISPR-associated protein, Cas1 family [Syntrophomonas wolfei subsp. wolfei str. Goettingen G311]
MNSDTRYIFSTGELFQKDFSIVFRKEDGNIYFPVKDTRELYCFNEVTLSTKLMQLLAKAGIVVHFFGYYENYIGTFYPKEYLLSGRLTVAQALAYGNNRLTVAKPIVCGTAKNIHFVLYHYYRHGKSDLKEFLDWLHKSVPKLVDDTGDIKQLLRIEGAIWAGFYQTFREILPESFAMNKRVKRPPDNPINALISFGNTLLYTKTITEIYHTHLNQTISFLHEPAERRFSLSLDLSEVFKPILVYRTIFDCVNNRKITVEKHFNKSLNYALLNDAGRKTFIEAFDERLNQTFEHNTLKRRISFKQAIRLDGYKLIKYILEGKKFVPFCMEDKK